jgi:hypothetical protein
MRNADVNGSAKRREERYIATVRRYEVKTEQP